MTSSNVASPSVPQQRKPQRLLPAAAQQEDIEVAVVVEVGAGDVQRIDLVAEAGRGGAVFERSRRLG